MHLFKESVEFNISNILKEFSLPFVSGAAFSKARYKIRLSFFKDLNKLLIDFHQRSELKRWNGYQLLAGDGTTVALPPSAQIKSHFDVHSIDKNGSFNCMAQGFMLYDVLNDFIVDADLAKMEDSEKIIFSRCLDNLPDNHSIIILDRNFGHFTVAKRLLSQKRNFCIRMSVTHSNFAKSVMSCANEDFITTWKPSDKERVTCRKYGQDSEPIKVRVSKVKLKSGETELLISSLYNLEKIERKDLKELYGLRWGVEEGFKKLKPKMKVENFGARKPEGVFQEFQAHIFLMNFISIMSHPAQKELVIIHAIRKLKYKFNWQNAFRFVRSKIVELLFQIRIEQNIEWLIERIKNSINAVKPNRNFPRNPAFKHKIRPCPNYK